MRRRLRLAQLILGSLFAAAIATSGSRAAEPWPDRFETRLAALALLQSLNAELLSHDSATLTLDRWCADHHLASPAKIVAKLDRSADKAPTAEQRRLLQVGPAEPIRYRHVKLVCGDQVLSEADNWYVPGRLTAAMNDQLEKTDIAFGRAVKELHFQRHTLSAKLLWSPLPQGWEMRSPPVASPKKGLLQIPSHVLQHQAYLTLPDGTPFSAVVETYTSAVLAFPPPAR